MSLARRSPSGNGRRPTSWAFEVPIQGPELAVRCPVRAELDHAPSLAPLRREPSLVKTLRSAAGLEFLRSTLTLIAGTGTQVAVISTDADDPSTRARNEKATALALRSGARVIVGSTVPTDHDGRRASRPDLLVRSDWSDVTPSDASWLPVIVRHHRLTRHQESASDVKWSPLDDLDPQRARTTSTASLRSGPLGEDSLRLAHHWRSLEAFGLAPTEGRPVGGVIDKDGSAWWLPLDEPRWPSDDPEVRLTALERYDRRFALRLEAIANRLHRDHVPEVERTTSPMRISECEGCPWFAVCDAEMEAADHISLVPGFRVHHAPEHERRGVSTRTELARLDWRTAAVIFGPGRLSDPVDLVALRQAASERPRSLLVTDLLGPDHPALARLRDHGVSSVGDLLDLDARTASYSGAPVGHLPSSIDQARAAVSGRVFRARGLERISAPRADVEVDVDMENVDAGVYLWGTYTTLRGPAVDHPDLSAAAQGYRPFLSWDPVGPGVAAEVFSRFWSWLSEIRVLAEAVGCTFAAYCYTNAEQDKMRQILAATPDHPDLPHPDEVEGLVASPQWVDLYQTVRTSLVTGGRLGLKKVAPLAGFAWRDTDPGGEQSMYWHDRAVTDPDPEVRDEHRRRILAYNEDDVLATLALRTWLSTADLPSVEDWERFRNRPGEG